MATKSKSRVRCDKEISRHPKHSIKQWEDTKYCSVDCSNKARSTHGMSGTKVHRAWCEIRKRCNNHNSRIFLYYGGRGIKLHSEWNDFEKFYQYIGDPPSELHEVERIENSKNYEPGNVKWATRAEQMRNTRHTRFVEFAGKRQCFKDFCSEHGLEYKLSHSRLLKGWTLENIIDGNQQKIN